MPKGERGQGPGCRHDKGLSLGLGGERLVRPKILERLRGCLVHVLDGLQPDGWSSGGMRMQRSP